MEKGLKNWKLPQSCIFPWLAASGLGLAFAQDSTLVMESNLPAEVRDSLELAARREYLRDSVYKELPNFTSFSQCEEVVGFTGEDAKACRDRLRVEKPFLEE